MHPFDMELLLLPGVLIFIATLWVTYYITSSVATSISAAFVKSGIFLIYFGVFFNGTFTFLDDWSYLNGAIEMMNEGIGLFNLSENLDFVFMTGGGEHIVYYLYNLFAFRIFAIGYYAPVAMNILLTILIAWFGAIIGAREFGFVGQWKKIFFMFLLFHPDILAWSNVMNGKDTLVLLLHVLLLFSVSEFFRGRAVVAFSVALPVVFILFFLRFYVPAIFAGLLVVNHLRNVNSIRSLYWFVVGSAILFAAMDAMVGNLIQFVLSDVQKDLVNPVFGFIRMLLTPIPFNTELNYSFLDFPAALHWLLIPFATYGIIQVGKNNSRFCKFFLLYVVGFMALYSIYGELQGPRHRVQIDFALAVCQFMGIKYYLVWMFPAHRFYKPSNVITS